VQYPLRRASWHTVGGKPGPRRGHTAARTFGGGPVQFANHSIRFFRGSEAVVGRLTGPVIRLVTMWNTLAANTFGGAEKNSRLPEVIQYAPSLATTALMVFAMSRKSLAIDQLST
jgi:hypothetical protein